MWFDVGVELITRQTTEVLGGEHRVVHKRHPFSARSTPSCGGTGESAFYSTARYILEQFCQAVALVLAVGTGSPNHDHRWAPSTDPRTVRRDLRSSGDVFLVELARDWRREAQGKVNLFSLSVLVCGARGPTLPPR